MFVLQLAGNTRELFPTSANKAVKILRKLFSSLWFGKDKSLQAALGTGEELIDLWLLVEIFIEQLHTLTFATVMIRKIDDYNCGQS